VRAVVRPARGAVQCHECAWDPARPEEAVATLRARIGEVRAIALAVGLAHCHVTAATLPPLTAAARRQVLRTEPDRFFAVAPATPLAVVVLDGASLALAADARLVDAWSAAFGGWARVVRVETAVQAVARALVARERATAMVAIDAADDEVGVVTVREGAIVGVRRTAPFALDRVPESAPPLPDVPASHAVAHGAALPAQADDDLQLLTPAREHQLARDRTRLVASWIGIAALWCGAALYAAGWSRDQVLLELENTIAATRPAATSAESLLVRVRQLDAEAEAITQGVGADAGADALGVLGAVGRALPRDAVAQRIRVSGDAWQVEGNAQQASAVLAALAAEPRFADVRFLAPSARYQDGTRTRETFAIAFAVR
jgi:hypothetical protein